MSRSDSTYSTDLGYDGIRVVFGSDTSPVACRGRIQVNPLAEELNGWVWKNPKKCLDMSGFFLYYTIYYRQGLRVGFELGSKWTHNSLIIRELELLWATGKHEWTLDEGVVGGDIHSESDFATVSEKKSAECLEMSIFLLYYTIIYSPFAAGGVWSCLL